MNKMLDPIENLKLVLEKYDRIGIWLSGGADSALGLYILQLYNEKTTILPIHGFDVRRRNEGQSFTSNMAVKNVLKKIRELLPKKSDLLYNTHVFEYFKPNGEIYKTKYHKPVEDVLMASGKIQIPINFTTKNPPIILHQEQQDPIRDEMAINLKTPFCKIDKKWIAKQYERHDLLESLFPLTVSCIGNKDTPCQSCFWCKEKYWAFGAYDGEIPNLDTKRL